MCKLILTYIDVSVPYTRSNTKLKLSLSVFYSPWALVTGTPSVSIPYTCSCAKLKLLLSVLSSPWALDTWSLGFLV